MNCGTTAVFLTAKGKALETYSCCSDVVPSVRFELTLDGF
jgi:hypothetical protein